MITSSVPAIRNNTLNDALVPLEGACDTGDASRHSHPPTAGAGDLVADSHKPQTSAPAPLNEDSQSPMHQTGSRGDTHHTPSVIQEASTTFESAVKFGKMPTSRDVAMCNAALNMFQANHKEHFNYLNGRIKRLVNNHSVELNWKLPKKIREDHKSTEIVSQPKRCLAYLASLRTVVIPIAN